MLITFVGLITLGPWYSMLYSDATVTLNADFTLVYFKTTVFDAITGDTTYDRVWSPKFPDLC